jgi:hypothetical protein
MRFGLRQLFTVWRSDIQYAITREILRDLGCDVARVGIFVVIITLIAGMASCIFVRYDLTVSSTEGGQVTTPGEATITYDKGAVVDLVAEPEQGYRFVGWTGDVDTIANVDAAATTITMNGRYSVLANFGLELVEIRTWHDLNAIRDNLSARYVLMDDLGPATTGYVELASDTANEGKGWQPIGTSDDQFTGSFDGQGHEIKDVFVNRPDQSYVGLFGEVGQEGVTKNIGVVDVTVVGNDYVGSLVGHTEGSLSNSYSTGNVTGQENVGSLVGHNDGIVSNSHSSGSVTGDWRVGGLVGWNQATLSSSYSDCTVTGNSSVGGLVGDNWHYDGTVSDSYATGSAFGRRRVGGLVGLNDYGSVISSYSTGRVNGDSDVGGLVGYDKGTVSNCFWDIQTSGQLSSDGGTGKTTAQMKNIAAFSGAGWNIIAVANHSIRNPSYIWNTVTGVTYPFLSWQP